MDTKKLPETELEYWIRINMLSALSGHTKKGLRSYEDVDNPFMKND